MPATVAMNAVTSGEARSTATPSCVMVRVGCDLSSYQFGPQLALFAAGAALALHAPLVAFAYRSPVPPTLSSSRTKKHAADFDFPAATK